MMIHMVNDWHATRGRKLAEWKTEAVVMAGKHELETPLPYCWCNQSPDLTR